jgi:hypothetical protein
MSKKKLKSPDKDRDPADAPPTGRFASLDPNKLRGGYYTSSEVADWLSAWATREQFSDMLRMLEANHLKNFHFTVEDYADGSWPVYSWGMSASLT